MNQLGAVIGPQGCNAPVSILQGAVPTDGTRLRPCWAPNSRRIAQMTDRDTVVVTDGGGSNSSGIILGVVVIILVLVGIWFFLLGGPGGGTQTTNPDVNVDVNLPSVEVPAPS